MGVIYIPDVKVSNNKGGVTYTPVTGNSTPNIVNTPVTGTTPPAIVNTPVTSKPASTTNKNTASTTPVINTTGASTSNNATAAQTEVPSVKQYYDFAQQMVDEQALLDKFNAATIAQYNLQREQNRQAENAFYNQMYNTQQTAMDTIRQANAAAVSTGASRGVQAAQELSALLGLQQESVASATDLAQANRETAQQETAAVLENVLNAYNQAEQQRQTLVQQGIEAASVDVQSEANKAAMLQAEAAMKTAESSQTQADAQKETAKTDKASLLTQAAENGTNTYLTALTQAGIDYSDGNVTPDSLASLDVALSNIGKTNNGSAISFNANDWAEDKSGASKAEEIVNTLGNICKMYGIDANAYKAELDALKTLANNTSVAWHGFGVDADNNAVNVLGLHEPNWATQWKVKTAYADLVQQGYQKIISKIRTDYASKLQA